MDKIHYSSRATDWETPKEFIVGIEKATGVRFWYDAASTVENKRCELRYEDGLKEKWADGTWCNPPYGRKLTQMWLDKAINESTSGSRFAVLTPARTDTVQFQRLLKLDCRILFVKGRIKFELNGKPILDKKGRPMPAPFPSAVIFFNYGRIQGLETKLEHLGVVR